MLHAFSFQEVQLTIHGQKACACPTLGSLTVPPGVTGVPGDTVRIHEFSTARPLRVEAVLDQSWIVRREGFATASHGGCHGKA